MRRFLLVPTTAASELKKQWASGTDPIMINLKVNHAEQNVLRARAT